MDIEEEHPRVAVLDPSKIQMQNRIGRGCQGCVYNAYHAETFQRYAVKVMNTKTMTEKEQERLKCEIESNFTLSSKSHLLYFPFFYGYWTTQTNVYLVFERCEGNALEGMSINRTPACSYSFAYVLLYDVLNALALLESKNIIHRDLKPENILLDRGHFKICDLGLSRIAEKGKKLTMDVGNIMSRSPQFYSGNYDCKTDIWSLGINAFWLAFGTLPFHQELKQMIKGKKIADIITRISKKQFTINFGKMDSYLLDVLKDMLEIQRDDRLGASQNLGKHFGGIQFDRGSNAGQLRFLFFRYLGLRSQDNSLALLYLILMLLVADFTKMDDHLKKCAQTKRDGNQTRQKGEQGKKQIVRRVKLNIFYLLKFITEQIQTEEEEIVNLYRFYIDLWREELERDPKNSKKVEKQVKKIEECLEIHKIKSIADKFPLVLEAVRVYRYMNQPEGQRLYLWDLHNLDLRKLKI